MAQEAPLLRFLALGDSYTIGESVPQMSLWKPYKKIKP